MESEFREFPFWLWDRNSLYWHKNIRIKFQLNFERFDAIFTCFMQTSHAKLKITKTKQKQVCNVLEMDLMMTSRSLWISRKIIRLKRQRLGWMCIMVTRNFPQSVIPYILVAMWQTSYRTCARAIWHIFLVSHNFASYFTRLKAREINRKNKKNSRNICHIAHSTMR